MRHSTWKRFLAAALAVVVLCALTRGLAQALLGAVVSAASVVAIIFGVRQWGREDARAWYCFAVGGTAVLTGNLILAVNAAVSSSPESPFPSPADALFVLGYLAIVAGEVVLVRRRSADIEGDNLIDSLMLTTGVGVLLSAYVMVPYGENPSLGLAEKLLNGTYTLLILAIVGVAGRLVVGSGRRNPSYYLLAGSFAFLVLTDVLVTMQTADLVPHGAAAVSSALTYVLFGTGALHPSMARLTDRPAAREIQLTRRRLALLFAALLLVPAAMLLDVVTNRGSNLPVMAGGSVAMTVLALARLAGLVRAKERKADRERTLREAAEALVGATTVEEIHQVALSALLALVGEGDGPRVSIAVGSGEELRVEAAAGPASDQALGTRVGHGGLPQPVREALSQRRAVTLEKVAALDLPAAAEGEEAGTVLVIPLVSRSGNQGAVCLTNDRPLESETVRAVETVASVLALALESASLTEEIHRRRHERRFRALVEKSADLVSVIGLDGRVNFVSPASKTMLGIPEDAMIGQHPFARMHPDDRYRASALLDRAWAVPEPAELIEARLRHGNGQWRWFEILLDNLLEEPEVAGMVIHARDITDRKEAQLRLQESEARFRSLVQHGSDVVIVLEDDLTMSYVSPSVERVLGHSTEELCGTSWSSLLHPDDAVHALERMAASPNHSLELRVRHRDGSWATLDLTVTDLRYDRAVRGIVLNGRDVTDRRALEEQLRHQALHDGLTGLANRTLFADRVDHALARGGDGRGCAVVIVDLDDFKNVNDGLGQAAGDVVLQQVSTRIEACLGSGDTAARLGADEFAVLLEDVVRESEVLAIVQRVQAAIRSAFVIEGEERHVTASIGVAISRGEAASAEALLRNADVAMYQAKSKGKNRYQVFDPGMHRLIFERLELKGDLSRAVKNHELHVLYQPIISLSSGQLTGLEALVRWHHPRQGLLSPDSFIPLAEESGVIEDLGLCVLNEACAQLRAWRDANASLSIGVSVNVSVRQLESPHFLSQVRTALEDHHVPSSGLTLEITETMLMSDVDMTAQRLSELKDLDVVIAVDDFGTGYSSLGNLQRLPVDVVKIDRSLIEPLGRKSQQTDFIRSVIHLARSFGLATVAEGIEQQEQVFLLRALGCDGAQGYHFSRPVPPETFDGLQAGTEDWVHYSVG